MGRRFTSERGAALLETAVVLPLVLLVSVGIFEFGRAYQVFQVCTNAAREGARISVLPGTTDTDVKDRVTAYLKAGQVTQSPNASWVNVDHTKTISIGGATAPATQVTLNYPFNFIMLNPVIQLVAHGSTLGSAFTMSTSALMRNE
jgi:Flp pilus assembly protein TadG